MRQHLTKKQRIQVDQNCVDCIKKNGSFWSDDSEPIKTRIAMCNEKDTCMNYHSKCESWHKLAVKIITHLPRVNE